jgi:hypothetical protein
VIATVTLLPALSVPDAGATVSSPSRLAGSVIDHETGPPPAATAPSPRPRGLLAGLGLELPLAQPGGPAAPHEVPARA